MLIANEILPAFGANEIEHEYGSTLSGLNAIGFPSGKGTWYWFALIDGSMYFDHSYSQIVGVTKKGRNARLTGERLAIKFANRKG